MAHSRRLTPRRSLALLQQPAGPPIPGDDDTGEASQLNQPWQYWFKTGQQVWVRTKAGNWHLGKVVRSPSPEKTRKGQRQLWTAVFNKKFRRSFSPLDGDIKPNTPHTRRLLKEAGWDVGERLLNAKDRRRSR